MVGQKMPNFWCLMECSSIFRKESGNADGDLRGKWSKLFADYSKKYPDLAEQINRMQHRELPDGWDKNLPNFPADAKGVATRESSGKVLNAIAQNVPWLHRRLGGFGDLQQNHNSRARKILRPVVMQAVTFISASANTPWPRR